MENENSNLPNDANSYAEYAKTIAANTVSKETYEAAQQEINTLKQGMSDLAQQLSYAPAASTDTSEQTTQPSIEELASKLCDGKRKTNLEYCSDLLAYRDAVLDQKGIDVFLNPSPDYVWNEDDAQMAQNDADGYRYLIEQAHGDPKIFNRELERIMDKPLRR